MMRAHSLSLFPSPRRRLTDRHKRAKVLSSTRRRPVAIRLTASVAKFCGVALHERERQLYLRWFAESGVAGPRCEHRHFFMSSVKSPDDKRECSLDRVHPGKYLSAMQYVQIAPR